MNEVEEYISGLPEPQRSTLSQLRRDLLDIIPGATERFSYGMPAVLLNDKAIAGYFAFKKHIGYFPHSSLVVPKLERELSGFKTSKGGFQFPLDQPLDKELVSKLVAARLEVLGDQHPDLFT